MPQAGLLVVAVTGERTGEFATVQGLDAIGAGAEVSYVPEGVLVLVGEVP